MLRIIKKKSNLIFLIFAIILSFPAVVGLLHSGFPLTDDGNWMVIRFSAFYEALRNGQFPVRFLFRLNNGFGYPVADFLYPLFMYIGVPIHIIGFNFANTVKIILGLSLVFSSIFTFLWLRKLFDNLSSLVGATLYVYFPYHLWDVYKRGSVGEVLALAIVPFVFWQIERKSLLWSSIGISLLILSHNTLAILFLFLVILCMLLDLFISKKRNKLLMSYALILGGGIGMSAFFWIPAILDLQYTVFSKTQVSDWNNYFAKFDLIGLSTFFIILATIALIIGRKIDIKKHRLTLVMLLLAIVSIFFASSSSSFFWNFLPVSFIQFPFRLLSVAIVCVSFLSCCIVSVLGGKVKIILAITILVILFISSKQFMFPSNFQYHPDTFYSTNQDTTTVKNEYMPKWIKKVSPIGPNEKITIITGEGVIDNLFTNGNKTTFSINGLSKLQIQFNTIYFPGWKVKVDGKETPIEYDNNGLIGFLINRGNHSVNIYFEETPLRAVSDLISLVSLFMIIILVIKDKRLIFKI